MPTKRKQFIVSKIVRISWDRNCRHCRKKRVVKYDIHKKEMEWGRVIFTLSDYYCIYCAQKLLMSNNAYITNVKTSTLDTLLRGKQ